MIGKRISTTCIAAALSLTSVSSAMADGSDIVGGIIGGVIGGVIVNEANRNRPQRTVVQRSTRTVTPSPVRAQNREIQTSLNYFGFPAGTPDGILGRRSRSAISEYQAHLGYPVTGELTEFQRNFLVNSYQRAQAGGFRTQQQIAQNPQGVRGLLTTYRDESLGIAQPALPQAATAQVAAPAPAAPAPQAAAPVATAGAGALPNFLAGDTAQASLASHCNKVSLLTNSNGGFITAATMTDPAMALNEQFCLARTYAITQGEDLADRLQGVTPQQIVAQCEGFGPALRDHVAAVSLKPTNEVVAGVSSFILESGMAPAQLAGTARICLSAGYRTDNMDVAMGSALVLVVLGERVYAELLGHHLAQGFGASRRPDLALAWYDIGFAAIDAGAQPVFNPGQPERTGLLRQAAHAVGGRAGGSQPDAGAPVPAAASGLPSFTLQAAETE